MRVGEGGRKRECEGVKLTPFFFLPGPVGRGPALCAGHHTQVHRVAISAEYGFEKNCWILLDPEYREQRIFGDSNVFEPQGWFYARLALEHVRMRPAAKDKSSAIWDAIGIPYERDRDVIRKCNRSPCPRISHATL